MKYRPLKSKILVKQYDTVMETNTGIIIETQNLNYKKPQKGEILAVGKDVVDKDLKVGCHIFFSMYAGANVYHNGSHMIVLGENEVFGILDDSTDLSVGQTHDTEGLLQAIEGHGLVSKDQF